MLCPKSPCALYAGIARAVRNLEAGDISSSAVEVTRFQLLPDIPCPEKVVVQPNALPFGLTTRP